MRAEELDRYDYPINTKHLIEKMQERVWEQGRPPYNRTNEWISAFTEALNIITNEPKCIVQCEDCKYQRIDPVNDRLGIRVCDIYEHTTTSDFFCALGERKGGDDE